MKQFYIITNQTKDKNLEITEKIKEYIKSKQRQCIVAVDGVEVPQNTDCILVIGGDGTLIRAAREHVRSNIPLLGINMGTLGYLTEAEIIDVEECLDMLMDDKAQIEERMMIKGVLPSGEEHVALNDIVLTRHGALRLIEFRVYVNGELLNTYRADGMIISTPTGSTAYNLSAGGPIVKPTAEMIVVTPICPHSLNNSSIILSAEDEIILQIGEGRDGGIENASVSFDGETNIEVKTGEQIVISRSENTTKLMKLSKVSFLEILRKKMRGN